MDILIQDAYPYRVLIQQGLMTIVQSVMRNKIPFAIRLPFYIVIAPFIVLYAVFVKNSREDWLRASSWFGISIILLICMFLALNESQHGWMREFVDFVGLWPYVELLALVVTPIFMWWLAPDDVTHTGFRVGITLFLAVMIIGGTPVYLRYVLENWLFVLAFLLVRFLPLYFRTERPDAREREAETIRLGLIVLYIFFLLLPGVAVVAAIWNNAGLDFHDFRYFHYFMASASYFFVMGCIELNLRGMVHQELIDDV